MTNSKALIPRQPDAITDDMFDAIMTAQRAILALPRAEQLAIYRAQMQAASDVQPMTLSFTGALTKLALLLQAVKWASVHGSDTKLRLSLDGYDKKILLASDELDKTIAQLLALPSAAQVEQIVQFDPEGEVKSVADLINLAGKYRQALVHVFANDKRSFYPLRELAASTPDLVEVMTIRSRAGRPAGLDPLTRMLAERADVIYKAEKRMTWQRIAERLYSDLLRITKRSQDEKDMIDWFKAITQDNWGSRLNDLWHDWQKWLKQ